MITHNYIRFVDASLPSKSNRQRSNMTNRNKLKPSTPASRTKERRCRPAPCSEIPTPRTDELRRELYRLKSNTLEYPCEVQLTQLCRELERENAILCDFINREMKMTASDKRLVELTKRIAGFPNDQALLRAEKGKP